MNRAGFTSPIRVLIADPDAAARRHCIDGLRELGCDAIEASDGVEALVEALVRRPSLIVLETRLPGVNGPALCEILRKDSVTRSVPIVAMTADGTAVDVDRIRRAGANSVLVKPIAPDTILAELRRLTVAPPDPPQPSAQSAPPHKAKSRTYARVTTTAPPSVPPTLRCPQCDAALTYVQSYIGGVSQRHAEQWDGYSCATCGTFEYRHRTRKLRKLSE